MKRYGNLWPDIVSMETLREAHRLAKIGKSHYTAVKMVERDVEGHLQKLRDDLLNKRFTTSEYTIEDRMEGGKLRRIYKLPYYPDRIVQHALMIVVGPIFRRSLIRDTFQSMPSRGTSDARRRVQKMMKTDPQKYALKMDIRKYYPNVDNTILKRTIRRKIKCKDTLWLADNIIDSMKGIPIGNLTSQYFGNFFLYEFDWWVKQNLKCQYYYRYCDDMVLFCNDKHTLRRWRREIEAYLNSLHLEIKPNWQVYDTEKQGVDFVGYVFKTQSTRLRKTVVSRLLEHSGKVKSGHLSPKQSLDTFAAYKGWTMRCNAKLLWRSCVSKGVVKYCNNVYKSNPLGKRI